MQETLDGKILETWACFSMLWGFPYGGFHSY